MGATAKYMLLPLAGPLVADVFDGLRNASNVQALRDVNLTASQLNRQGVLNLLSDADYFTGAGKKARAALYALASLYEDGFKVWWIQM